MKHLPSLTLTFALLLLCGCGTLKAKEPLPPPVAPKVLAVPVGKNWEVREEAPKLTNERSKKLPFQTEESIQPEGTKTIRPAEKRIETPR